MWFQGFGKRAGLFIPFKSNYCIQMSQGFADDKYRDIANLQKEINNDN